MFLKGFAEWFDYKRTNRWINFRHRQRRFSDGQDDGARPGSSHQLHVAADHVPEGHDGQSRGRRSGESDARELRVGAVPRSGGAQSQIRVASPGDGREQHRAVRLAQSIADSCFFFKFPLKRTLEQRRSRHVFPMNFSTVRNSANFSLSLRTSKKMFLELPRTSSLVVLRRTVYNSHIIFKGLRFLRVKWNFNVYSQELFLESHEVSGSALFNERGECWQQRWGRIREILGTTTVKRYDRRPSNS